jgi:hypothetical protein
MLKQLRDAAITPARPLDFTRRRRISFEIIRRSLTASSNVEFRSELLEPPVGILGGKIPACIQNRYCDGNHGFPSRLLFFDGRAPGVFGQRDLAIELIARADLRSRRGARGGRRRAARQRHGSRECDDCVS